MTPPGIGVSGNPKLETALKNWHTDQVPRSIAREQDILKLIAKAPPRLTSRRIGIHTSSAGGVHNAAERAYRLGCNTFQIFLFQSAAVGSL